MLTVTGIFREKNKAGTDGMRSFQKSMVIVPSGSGFCIKNEMLHINNVTIHQIRSAFKPPATAATATINSPQVAAAAAVTTAAAAPPAAINETTKMQMIQAMSLHSNMNAEWSRK